ncbi:uncharacterized protein PHACADRAFT_259998 [Phanerochaete carnosa HHB-10118-sp]|uniref:Uncharacterized protein n=1 Tax=Phanerochaete carnosa (strain HHB-10118-sp) TaxID=650164 RepID=K5W3R7_PHACS|nr:uncharacterized protein PHACADRAFT_259998 [Phanerochaete carnosa HHB-10118-sp]EKM53574.1 hypothetical protein PHACADRAFT_259998 [Phanerochaete carnosa HHB-10118-sp]
MKENTHSRVPFSVLATAGSPSEPAHSRPPTPYHPNDDLEDMYLNPNPDLYLPEEPETLDTAPALDPVLPSESEEAYDPLSTPHPRHVANILPLASPFSSREATPCDRSLVDSPLSSPSPVKPLTVTRTLPVAGSTTKKKEMGRLIAARAFASSTPASTPLPSARKVPVQPSSVKPMRPMPPPEVPKEKRVKEATKKSAQLGKMKGKVKAQEEEEEEVQDPMMISQKLEKLLPKRTVRRRANGTAAITETSQPRSRGRPRKKASSPQESEAGSGSESGGGGGESSSPLATRKRKAPARATHQSHPVKRMRVEVVISRPPPHLRKSGDPSPVRSRAKPASSKPASTRRSAKAKGKGREHAGLRKVGEEDSVRVPRPHA